MEFDREYRKIMEAISLGDARKHKLSKKHSGAYDEVLDEVFGGKNRIMMPLNIDYSTIDNAHLLFLKIDEFLDKHGYSVETLKDYIDGKAVKFKVDSDGKHIYDTKNPVKIGKLLQKYEEDGEIEVTERKDGKKTTKTVVGKPLLHEFKNDPIRASNGEFLIVISRHPYDVAGASTDRSWTSCMDLGLERINYPNKEKRKGVNSEYVKFDITEGTLVAYVVTRDELFKGAGGEDKVKIQKPLSRILIKPHHSDVGKLYTIGNMYGSNYPEFYQRIQEWILETLNAKAKNVKDVNAKRNVNLYPDYDTPVGFEMKSLNNVIGILRKRAFRISGRFKNVNVGVVYDAEEDDFFEIWITFKYDISKCNLPKESKITEKMLKQIKTMFDPGDFYIKLDHVDIVENMFNIIFILEDDDFDNIKQGMYRLGEIEEYLEWIEQNVDPEICEIMGELGLNNSIDESFQFNKEYRKLMLEFSEGAIRKIVQKFYNDATEQEIRREVADFEKYKQSLQKKDPFQYKSWIEFTEAIHAAKGKAEFKNKKIPDESQITSTDDIIADDENVTIYKGDSQNKCVMYGKGYTFCISRQAGGNMFSKYRLSKESTFYFIYFKKKPKTEKDHIMVLDHTNKGYEWTFADNNTQTVKDGWDTIVSEYPELGRYEKFLVNKKLDDVERNELKNINIFYNNPTLEKFNKFSYKGKAQALKSVVAIPNNIWGVLDKTLRNEFLSVGPNLTSHQENNLTPYEIRRYEETRKTSTPELILNRLLIPNKFDDLQKLTKYSYNNLSISPSDQYFLKSISYDVDLCLSLVKQKILQGGLIINIPEIIMDEIIKSPEHSFELANWIRSGGDHYKITDEILHSIGKDENLVMDLLCNYYWYHDSSDIPETLKKYMNTYKIELRDIEEELRRLSGDRYYSIHESTLFDKEYRKILKELTLPKGMLR